jgi:flagella basal body P-ring formation protein FlgA
MRTSLTVAAAFLCFTAGAEAATLRTATSLAAPVVRLADLFDDAGPNAERVLGPGPGPGGRIVVESAQLGAIARQFAVDWRPISSGDRAVLDRPGRTLRLDEALEPIRAALADAGAPPGFELELLDFVPPVVPPEGKLRVQVTQLAYDPTAGRFGATLSVGGETMTTLALRVVGRAEETVELPVAVSRLLIGSVLRADDLRMARVRLSQLHSEMARRPEEAIGMQLRRQMMAGQPLALSDLTRPALVQRNATVLMQLDTAGLSLTGQGQALGSGAAGDRVRVLNPASHAVIEAEVTGPNRVRVEPDGTPIIAAVRAGQVAVR